MSRLDSIQRNENEVNELVLKLLKRIILSFPVIAILNALKVFIVPWTDLIFIIVLGVIVCTFPLIYRKLEWDECRLKYVVVFSITVLVTIIYGLNFATVILLWFLPIGIACLYFDKKLVLYTFILVFL